MTTLTSTPDSRRYPRVRPVLRWLLVRAGRLHAGWSRAGARGQLGSGYDVPAGDHHRSAQYRVGIPRIH